MSKSEPQRTGYDYIPSPGEEYFPEGKTAESTETGTVLADNGRNKLIRKQNGDVVLTDQNGRRAGG